MFDYGDNDPMKIEKIYSRVRAFFKPMLAAIQKTKDGGKDKPAGDKKEKITFEGIKRLVREAAEEVEDFNTQSAVDSAEAEGASKEEVQAVMDASTNDEERIAMLKNLSAVYPSSQKHED